MNRIRIMMLTGVCIALLAGVNWVLTSPKEETLLPTIQEEIFELELYEFIFTFTHEGPYAIKIESKDENKFVTCEIPQLEVAVSMAPCLTPGYNPALIKGLKSGQYKLICDGRVLPPGGLQSEIQ